MSFIFSRALVEACLGESCSGIDAYVQSNEPPMPNPSWSRGRTTEAFPHSRFGTTFAHFEASRGEALLTSWLAGSRARTSPPPAEGTGSTENRAASGERWRASFAKWSPATSSWRTPQLSLAGDLEEFSGTWPRWGSMLAGECWEQDTWALPTSATGSGSLPTPSGTSNHGKNHVCGRLDEWGGSSNPWRGSEIGRTCSPAFEEWVMGWPEQWTAPTAYETARFQRWLQLHGKS